MNWLLLAWIIHESGCKNRANPCKLLYEQRGRDPATIRISPKFHLHFTVERDRPLSGSPRQILEDLLAYREQGVEEFIFYCPGASEAEKLEYLQRIAEEIVPRVDSNL